VGLGAPLFWGVVMAFFALLPVVGSAAIWVPAAIWLMATGHWGRGLVLVAICAGVAGTVDNLLRPVLLSGRARLSGLLVFISLLGGISVFGVLGVVLGPIVVATTAGILDVYTRREETG
jgi:predicted PurR-regulated permease PerM